MVGTTSADPVGRERQSRPFRSTAPPCGCSLSATCGGSPTATLKWSPASNRAWLGHASARMATWCSSAATKPASGGSREIGSRRWRRSKTLRRRMAHAVGWTSAVFSMASDGTDLYVSVHVGGILRSADGVSWSPTIDLHDDVHQVTVSPDRTVWAATGSRALRRAPTGAPRGATTARVSTPTTCSPSPLSPTVSSSPPPPVTPTRRRHLPVRRQPLHPRPPCRP